MHAQTDKGAEHAQKMSIKQIRQKTKQNTHSNKKRMHACTKVSKQDKTHARKRAKHTQKKHFCARKKMSNQAQHDVWVVTRLTSLNCERKKQENETSLTVFKNSTGNTFGMDEVDCKPQICPPPSPPRPKEMRYVKQNVTCGRNVPSAQTLEVSLIGVGTVFRLERDARSMARRLGHATQ